MLIFLFLHVQAHQIELSKIHLTPFLVNKHCYGTYQPFSVTNRYPVTNGSQKDNDPVKLPIFPKSMINSDIDPRCIARNQFIQSEPGNFARFYGTKMAIGADAFVNDVIESIATHELESAAGVTTF